MIEEGEAETEAEDEKEASRDGDEEEESKREEGCCKAEMAEVLAEEEAEIP